MEILILILLAIGSLCGLAGGIWTIVVAAKNEEWLYAIGGFFCGILLFVYAVQNLGECKIPLILMTVGVGSSIVLNLFTSAGAL